MTDPIADMLTRIRNAVHSRHQRVDVPASTFKAEIAKILEQEPDRRISWKSVGGKPTEGTVHFEPAGPSRTKVRLQMRYQPEGIREKVGAVAGLDKRRIRGDLERFQELVEQRGEETGAWRGEVHGDEVKGGDAWPPTLR